MNSKKPRRHRLRIRHLAWVGALLLALLSISLVWINLDARAADDSALVRVQRKPIAQSMMLSGKIFPDKAMVITAQQSGRIVSLHVKEGSVVKADEPLFTMQLEAAGQAEILAQRSQVRLLEHQVASARRRHAKRSEVKDLIGVEEVASEESDIQRMELELGAARERLRLVEGSLGLSTKTQGQGVVEVRSPIEGIVTLLDKRPGDFILGGGGLSAGSVDLGGSQERMAMVVADMSQLQVRIKVLEADLRYMQKGLPVLVRLDAYPEKVYEGELVQVGGQGRSDPGTGNTYFDVFVAIRQADAHLLPEMNATVDLTIAKRDDALTLPVSCVLILPHQSLVRVRDASQPSGYRFVPVQTGITSATDVEIVAGLQEGEGVMPIDFAAPEIVNMVAAAG